jgi:hypothetical protein
MIFLAGGAVAVLLTPPAKAVARRAALARARTPRRRAVTAFRLLESGAADVGLGRGPGETPWEYLARLARALGLTSEHLDRLTAISGRAMYAPGDLPAGQAQEAVAAARLALRDIRRRSGALRVVAGALRPPGRFR